MQESEVGGEPRVAVLLGAVDGRQAVQVLRLEIRTLFATTRGGGKAWIRWIKGVRRDEHGSEHHPESMIRHG